MLEAMASATRTWGPLAVVLRLLLATIVGIAIGAERERHNKDAGMKTHVLVCVGSALCMIVSQYMECEAIRAPQKATTRFLRCASRSKRIPTNGAWR